jgi:hypothetical protein
VLRSAGLLRDLGARDAGTVGTLPYRLERDVATGIRNREGVAAQTRELAALVGSVLDRHEWPLVLGATAVR